MSSFGSLAISVLQNLDPNLNGGIFTHVLQFNLTSLQKSNLYLNYVLSQFRGFYLGSTVAMACVCLFSMLTVLLYTLISQIYVRRKLLQAPLSISEADSSSTNQLVYKNPAYKVELQEKLEIQSTKSTNSQTSSCGDQLTINALTNHRTFMIQFCIILFLLCLSIVFVAMSIGVQEYVLQDISSNQSHSIRGTIRGAAVNINAFLNEIDQQSLTLIKATINKLLDQVAILVYQAVSSIVEQLFTQLNINKLFNVAQTLTNNLYKVINTMTLIKANQYILIQEMAVYESNLNTTRDEFQQLLPKLCPQLSSQPSLYQQCLSVQTTLPQIVVNMDVDKLNFDSVVTVLFTLTQYNLNVTTMQAQVNDSKAATSDLLNTAYKNLLASINIPTLNASANDLVTSAHNALKDLQGTILRFTNSTAVESSIRYCTLVYVLLVLLPLTAFLVYLLIGCLVFLLVESAFYLNPHWCPRLFTALLNHSTTKLYSFHRLQQLSHVVRAQYFSHNVHLALLVSVVTAVLLPTIAMLLMFVLSGVVHNEVCKQITSPSPIQLIDNSLQDFFNRTWPKLVDDVLSNVNISQDILSNVDLSPPTQLLTSIYSNCSSTNGSLLPALGYTKFINVAGVLNSSFFASFIETGRNTTKDELSKVNVISLIPSSLETVLASSKDLVKTFIDDINHNATLLELQKTFLINNATGKAFNGTEYFFTLNQFMSAYLNLYPGNTDAIVLHSYSQRMNTFSAGMLPDINNLLGNMRTWFTTLQNNRNVSNQITQLIDAITTVKTTFTNRVDLIAIVDVIYYPVIDTLKSEAVRTFDEIQVQFVQNILRCNYIHMTFTTATSSVCDHIVYDVGGLAMQLIFSLPIFILLCAAVSGHLYTRYWLKHGDISDC